MDTPQKNRIGTPGSKIEESPIFNYLRNLSPIKQVKSTHISQSFTSLNLTSPSCVFTSPNVVSSFRDSTFLKRHGYSDQSKHENSYEGNKDKSNEQFVGSSQLPDDATKKGLSLLRNLEYDYGTSPSLSKSQMYAEQHAGGSAEASSSIVPFDAGMSKETSDKCDADDVPGTFENTPQRERLRLHWDNLAADATNSLFLGTPSETRAFQGLFDRSLDSGENPGSLSSLFPEKTNDLQLAQPVCQLDSDGAAERQQVCTLEDNPQPYLDWPPVNIPTDLEEHTDNYSSANIDNQLVSSSHQGVRRRCLTFDTFGGQKKMSIDAANRLPYPSLQSKEKGASCFKQSIPVKPASSYSSRSVKSGIGLHLNALATVKDEDVSIPANLPPGVEILHTSSSTTSFCSPAVSQEALCEPLHTTSNPKEAEPLTKDTQASDDNFQETAASEELNTTSPRKKRPKLANAGDDEASCKRCNCKKSKCLKLYCECFAAGVYCIEPCSCQDCFNKPIHEETVLATRKQIEARNPLAFAPKVIRALQSTSYVGDETANTPASARHKRGCNCKKSSCLKKYCECYQGGVGCSVNCRCESCKNTFGRKDGLEVELEAEIEAVEEDSQTEKHVTERMSQKAVVHIDKDQNLESSFPASPSRLSRLSVKLQFPSKGKPMRSSFLSIGSSANDTKALKLSSIPRPPKFEKSIPITDAEEIPELLQEQVSPRNTITSNSPNSKRVSPPQCKSRPSPSRRSTRRLILQAIPSLPSSNPQ